MIPIKPDKDVKNDGGAVTSGDATYSCLLWERVEYILKFQRKKNNAK